MKLANGWFATPLRGRLFFASRGSYGAAFSWEGVNDELQPAERLWPLVTERVDNRLFEDLDELEEALL